MSEPLPEQLQRLVASEAVAPVTSEAAQAAVRAKLHATLGIATVAGVTAATAKVGTATASTASVGATATTAGGAAATATTAAGVAAKTALSLKLLAVVVAGGTTVATIAVTRDHHGPAPVVERAPRAGALPTPTPRPASAVRVEPIVEPIEEPAPAVEPAPASESPRPRVPPRTKSPATPPAEAQPPPPTQRQLLADASRALSLGDAARALSLIEEDARRHSDGPLGEERDALRISVLLVLGRSDDARAAARQLLATYPGSIHRPLAERVLAKETP